MNDGCRQSSVSYLVFSKVQKLAETIIFEYTSYDISSHLLGESSRLRCLSDSTSLFIELSSVFSDSKYLTKVFALDKKGNPCYIQKYVTSQLYPPSKIWNLEKDLFMKDCENFITDDKVSFCVSITDLSIINTDQYELKDECIQTSREKDDVACLDSLSADFRKLLVSGAEHDVLLNSGSWQFPVHKTVLSSRSEVFSAMFRSNMKEAKDGVVNVDDIHPLDTEQFLKYVYSGKMDNLTEESAVRLYEIADKYAVESLRKKCSDILVELLTPETACRYLLLAEAHNDSGFKISCMNFIIQREEIMKTREWADLSIQHPNLGVEVFGAYFQTVSRK